MHDDERMKHLLIALVTFTAILIIYWILLPMPARADNAEFIPENFELFWNDENCAKVAWQTNTGVVIRAVSPPGFGRYCCNTGSQRGNTILWRKDQEASLDMRYMMQNSSGITVQNVSSTRYSIIIDGVEYVYTGSSLPNTITYIEPSVIIPTNRIQEAVPAIQTALGDNAFYVTTVNSGGSSGATTDKSTLQATYDDAISRNLDSSGYTPETWEAYSNALSQANTVLNDENATQEQIDAALEALVNAFNGLAVYVAPTEVGTMPERPATGDFTNATYPYYIGSVHHRNNLEKAFSIFGSTEDVHAFILAKSNSDQTVTAKLVIYKPAGEGENSFGALRHYADRDTAVTSFYKTPDLKYIVGSFTEKNNVFYNTHNLAIYYVDYADQSDWMSQAVADGIFDRDMERYTTEPEPEPEPEPDPVPADVSGLMEQLQQLGENQNAQAEELRNAMLILIFVNAMSLGSILIFQMLEGLRR